MWAKISKTKVKKVLYPHCLRCNTRPPPSSSQRTNIYPIYHLYPTLVRFDAPNGVLYHTDRSVQLCDRHILHYGDAESWIGGGPERLSCTASENGRLPAEQIAPRPPRCLPRERPSPSSDRHSRCPSSSPPPPPLSPPIDHRALATCPEQQPQQEPRSSSRS